MKKYVSFAILAVVFLLLTSVMVKGDSEDSNSKGNSESSKGSSGSSSANSEGKSDNSKSKGITDKSENIKQDEAKESKIGGGESKVENKVESKQEEEKKEKTKNVVEEKSVDDKETAKTEIEGGKTETEETNTFIDEKGNVVVITTKTETEEGESEIVVETRILNPDGTETVIKKKTETEGGKTETVFEKKIINPDGTEIKIKTKTEVKDGQEEVKNSIEVKGVEVTTKLSIKEETEGNKTVIKAKLSTGTEQNIIVLPDKALQIAFGELQAANNFVFELKEALDGEKRKIVFSATATKAGKLLGIFDTQVNLETLIDTVTGKIIETKKPWWAFLIIGANDATICHVSGENKRGTLKVAIPAVKSHLAHGDTLGECPVICGDGMINEPEVCDDGNVIGGDGCSSSCQIEVIVPPLNNATII